MQVLIDAKSKNFTDENINLMASKLATKDAQMSPSDGIKFMREFMLDNLASRPDSLDSLKSKYKDIPNSDNLVDAMKVNPTVRNEVMRQLDKVVNADALPDLQTLSNVFTEVAEKNMGTVLGLAKDFGIVPSNASAKLSKISQMIQNTGIGQLPELTSTAICAQPVLNALIDSDINTFDLNFLNSIKNFANSIQLAADKGINPQDLIKSTVENFLKSNGIDNAKMPEIFDRAMLLLGRVASELRSLVPFVLKQQQLNADTINGANLMAYAVEGIGKAISNMLSDVQKAEMKLASIDDLEAKIQNSFNQDIKEDRLTNPIRRFATDTGTPIPDYAGTGVNPMVTAMNPISKANISFLDSAISQYQDSIYL